MRAVEGGSGKWESLIVKEMKRHQFVWETVSGALSLVLKPDFLKLVESETLSNQDGHLDFSRKYSCSVEDCETEISPGFDIESFLEGDIVLEHDELLAVVAKD